MCSKSFGRESWSWSSSFSFPEKESRGPKLESLRPGVPQKVSNKSQDKSENVRQSVMSIEFPPVILGPEMAAPILWAPGIFCFFLLENPRAHKIPPFRGGGGGFWVFLEGGGWKCQFYFMGVGIFPRMAFFKLSGPFPRLSLLETYLFRDLPFSRLTLETFGLFWALDSLSQVHGTLNLASSHLPFLESNTRTL